MTVKLSILIPTIPEREEERNALKSELHRQIDEMDVRNQVEILYDPTPRGQKSVGKKRNELIEKAHGEYVAHHDDDDFPAPNYLRGLWGGIHAEKDIVTFDMNYFEKGVFVRKYIINLLGGEAQTKDTYVIDRIFFHLCAIKREIAIQVKFPDINFREDEEYSYLIKPLLKTEHHIGEPIYNYFFSERLSATRFKEQV